MFNRDALKTPALTEEELLKIDPVIDLWRHPWEMATFNVKSIIGRSIGKFDGFLGKEFMTSLDAVPNPYKDSGRLGFSWYGEILVNQESSAGMQQYINYDSIRE